MRRRDSRATEMDAQAPGHPFQRDLLLSELTLANSVRIRTDEHASRDTVLCSEPFKAMRSDCYQKGGEFPRTALASPIVLSVTTPRNRATGSEPFHPQARLTLPFRCRLSQAVQVETAI